MGWWDGYKNVRNNSLTRNITRQRWSLEAYDVLERRVRDGGGWRRF